MDDPFQKPCSSAWQPKTSEQAHDHSVAQTHGFLDVVNIHADDKSEHALNLMSSSQQMVQK